MGEYYIFRNFHIIILDQTVIFRKHPFILLTCSNKYSLPESMSVCYQITSYRSPYCVSLVDIKIMTKAFSQFALFCYKTTGDHFHTDQSNKWNSN